MKKTLLIISLCFSLSQLQAQSFTDVTFGTSKQDRAFVNLAYRYQFSDAFRAGIELETGLVNYRFIGAKVIDEGVSTTVSLPTLLRLYQQDNFRLDLYSKVGARFQSVSTNYEREEALPANTSFGFIVEPGLAVTYLLGDRLSLQSGVTLPLVFEASPEFIFENNVTNLFANLGYQLGKNSVFLLKTSTGPAAGASGDSQKYVWSAQAGLRFLFGGGTRASIIPEPSF
ncbi:MAG: hypothetical protein WA954_04380 [Parerythrobacter sp.]